MKNKIGLLCLFLAGCFVFSAALAVPGRANAQDPIRPSAISEFSPASVKAARDLRCTLHPPASPSTGIPVFTDADGYARFHAVRPSPGSTAETLTLSCTDAAGGAVSYPVDLNANETFADRPLDIASEPGIDRPALIGDPMSRTQADLIRGHYGLRPDPAESPALYAAWLEAAKKPGRILFARRPNNHGHPVMTQSSPFWLGAVLTGSAPYDSIQANFNMPKAMPGAFGTTSTMAVFWPGVGRFGTTSGLIQAGVGIQTTSTAAVYFTWREFCCGGVPGSDTYGGNFTPSPGAQILAMAWHCDANGLKDINGGFGCTYVADSTFGHVFDCTQPPGSPSNPPCSSVPAFFPQCSVSPSVPGCMTIGNSAEFILELQSPGPADGPSLTDPFPPFASVVEGQFFASTQTGEIKHVLNDPIVVLAKDWPHKPPPISVRLGTSCPVPEGRPIVCFEIGDVGLTTRNILFEAERKQGLMLQMIAGGQVVQAAALTGQTIADYLNYAVHAGADVRRAAQDVSALSVQLAAAGRSAEAVMTQQAVVDVLAGFTPAAADRLNFLLLRAEGRQALMGRLIADARVEQAAALTGQTIADYRNYAALQGADVRRAAQDVSALSVQLAAAGRSAEAVMTQQAVVDVLAGFTPAAADRLNFLLLLAEGRQALMERLIADAQVEQAAALTGQTIADYRNYAAQQGADVRRAAGDLSVLSVHLQAAGRLVEAALAQQAAASL
jgi:hypothetical protein